jgi:hypothetical protein
LTFPFCKACTVHVEHATPWSFEAHGIEDV